MKESMIMTLDGGVCHGVRHVDGEGEGDARVVTQDGILVVAV